MKKSQVTVFIILGFVVFVLVVGIVYGVVDNAVYGTINKADDVRLKLSEGNEKPCEEVYPSYVDWVYSKEDDSLDFVYLSGYVQFLGGLLGNSNGFQDQYPPEEVKESRVDVYRNGYNSPVKVGQGLPPPV